MGLVRIVTAVCDKRGCTTTLPLDPSDQQPFLAIADKGWEVTYDSLANTTDVSIYCPTHRAEREGDKVIAYRYRWLAGRTDQALAAAEEVAHRRASEFDGLRAFHVVEVYDGVQLGGEAKGKIYVVDERGLAELTGEANANDDTLAILSTVGVDPSEKGDES